MHTTHTIIRTQYAYFKYAKSGPCHDDDSKRPSMFDPIGRSKFDKWKGMGRKLSKEEARALYVECVKKYIDV
jgi:acyl-CoA-binding protein